MYHFVKYSLLHLLSVAFVLALLVGDAAAAPVPSRKPRREKPKPRPTVEGAWRMTWGHGQGEVIFYKNGSYWCLWSGQQWVGSWHLDGVTLHVSEGKVPDRPDDVPESPLYWKVLMAPCCRHGDGDHDGRKFEFKLER